MVSHSEGSQQGKGDVWKDSSTHDQNIKKNVIKILIIEFFFKEFICNEV